MASHNEIKVGDTDWVVRVQGEDVRVKVMDKTKKASGRGYEFRLRRIGPDGRVFGRALTRGSGAMRRQGDPVKAFGGKTQRTAGSKRKAPPKPPSPPKKKTSARRSTPPKAQANRPVTSPAMPSFAAAPAPSLPAPLESLRGRGRSRRSSPAKASAPAQATGKDTIQVRVGNDLIKKVVRRLEKIPASTPDYMLTSTIRNAVAEILAHHERNRYNAGFAAYGR